MKMSKIKNNSYNFRGDCNDEISFRNPILRSFGEELENGPSVVILVVKCRAGEFVADTVIFYPLWPSTKI